MHQGYVRLQASSGQNPRPAQIEPPHLHFVGLFLPPKPISKSPHFLFPKTGDEYHGIIQDPSSLLPITRSGLMNMNVSASRLAHPPYSHIFTLHFWWFYDWSLSKTGLLAKSMCLHDDALGAAASAFTRLANIHLALGCSGPESTRTRRVG